MHWFLKQMSFCASVLAYLLCLLPFMSPVDQQCFKHGAKPFGRVSDSPCLGLIPGAKHVLHRFETIFETTTLVGIYVGIQIIP